MSRFTFSTGWLGMVTTLLFATSPISAGLVQICDTQPNIDYACKNCTPTVRELPIAIFNYSSQPKLTSIKEIEFSMSMQVANPNANLHLALDGIDTGIALNGFQTNSLVEKTFKLNEASPDFLSPAKEQQLLDALKDGQVFASIVAAKPEDLKVQLYSDTNVKLCLTGPQAGSQVPEPTTSLIWGAAGLGCVYWRRRTSV